VRVYLQSCKNCQGAAVSSTTTLSKEAYQHDMTGVDFTLTSSSQNRTGTHGLPKPLSGTSADRRVQN